MGRRSDQMKEYYTANELARLLRVTDKVIYQMARAGELAHDVAGRVMRFHRADVEHLLPNEAAGEPAPRPAPGRKKIAFGVLGCAVLGALAWQRARAEKGREKD